MAVNPENVRVAITGAVSLGAYGATPPTSASSIITPTFVDLGGISEDGVTKTLPNSGDATPIKVWQNGATVRTLRTTSDDLPTWQFTCVETKKEVIEIAYGVTISGTDGSFTWKNDLRSPAAFVIDVIDGSYLERDFIPRAIVSEIAEVQLANTSAIGYQITIEGELHPVLNYNFKAWKTALIEESSSSDGDSSSSS